MSSAAVMCLVLCVSLGVVVWRVVRLQRQFDRHFTTHVGVRNYIDDPALREAFDFFLAKEHLDELIYYKGADSSYGCGYDYIKMARVINMILKHMDLRIKTIPAIEIEAEFALVPIAEKKEEE